MMPVAPADRCAVKLGIFATLGIAPPSSSASAEAAAESSSGASVDGAPAEVPLSSSPPSGLASLSSAELCRQWNAAGGFHDGGGWMRQMP